MAERFAARTRDRLRAEILDAAAEEVLAGGWKALRMQAVADAVGVSRQTVHNEFQTKQGLARALTLRIAARYHESTARVVEHSPDLRTALRDAVRNGMQLAADDPLVKTLLGAEGGETFLPLYTSEGAPVVDQAVRLIGSAFSRRFPEVDPDRMALVMETSTRYVLSHILLATRPVEKVAADAAALFGDYLLLGVTPPG